MVVVVIAEDSERSLRRVRQWRQQFRDRVDVGVVLKADVVAAEHDQVGSGILEQLHRVDHIVGRHGGAVMDVGDHADAKTIQGGRQAPDRDVLCEAGDLVTSVRGAVRAQPGECADRDAVLR